MAKDYYVDGNTVRKPQGAETRAPHRSRQEEIEHRKLARRTAARENRENSRAIRVGNMVFITVSVIAIVATAFFMIQAQASVTASMKQVAALESKVSDLKAENDAKYNEIVTSVDLNYIKQIATEELGMSYATEDQIIYYTLDKTNFMDQYSDIPQ